LKKSGQAENRAGSMAAHRNFAKLYRRKGATMRRVFASAACLMAGIFLVSRQEQTRAANSDNSKAVSISSGRPDTRATSSWDPKAAAAYLDQRAGWWMAWPRAARDHETFCISCHTAVPYAMSRPALRGALGEQQPSANERKLLDNVTKRVRLWKEVAPFYSDADRGVYKTVESRGTESVLNALILASNDASSGAQSDHLSDGTLRAFENMWAEQQTSGAQKGAWLWLRFKNEPCEADDSDYYGAALAAIAVGTAPENYRSRPEIQTNLKMLREYLNREYSSQTLSNRAVVLWASAKLPGLLEPERQKALVNELLSMQQPDGGWSLTSMAGGWKRHDGTAQDVQSDGYATGLITFALLQAGISPEKERLKDGLAWLASRQNKADGYWLASSLNNNEEHHISPDTVRFMKDAATAYAVLALSESKNH
jgi:squalene-hopene/tetraprenyl-beta-curcumene cyclase